MDPFYIAFSSFLIIAIIYSSVGFGGGSSYLAILALISADIFFIRSTALLCNIVVVGFSSYLFIKNNGINLRKLIPYFCTSVPFAFLGGLTPISSHLFFTVLSLVLFLTVIALLFSKINFIKREINYSLIAKLAIGAAIGYLSGITGIGGGIFLSPFLYLSRFGDSKHIAGFTALFILINSIAGLSGLLIKSGIQNLTYETEVLMLSALIGGQVGSHIGLTKMKAETMRKITAALILLVGLKLFNDHTFMFI